MAGLLVEQMAMPLVAYLVERTEYQKADSMADLLECVLIL